MAKDPAFLFYPGDWLGGTMGMTIEQKGCYFELLMLQFNLGKFNDQQIRHTLGASYDAAWPIVKGKFKTDGTYYWNEKLDSEKAKRRNFTDSRKKNLHKGTHMQTHTEQRMENENEDVNVLETANGNKGVQGEISMIDQFEAFWNAYQKPVAKFSCQHLWVKISAEDRKTILEYVPRYVISTPDKSFRKNPETFLFNEGWKDEIIVRVPVAKPGTPAPTDAQYKKPIKTTGLTAERTAALLKENNERLEKLAKEYKPGPVQPPTDNRMGSRIREQFNKLAPKP